MELNPRIKIIIVICIIMFILSGIPIKFIKESIYPPKINETENHTIIIYQNITTIVTVTPKPDGKIYFVSEYEQGIRKIQHPFSFIREKAIGNKDLYIHSVIYDYREFNKYYWFNPSDYKYYPEYPQNPDNKFIFVFANIYSDDISGDDTGFWIPEGTILLQTNNNVYSPINISKQLRIKELEEINNYNNDYKITAFNSIKLYSSNSQYKNTAGEYSVDIDILRGGKSNAIDGYLLFEIPKNTNIKDIIVWWNIHSFGQSGWRLKI